MDQPFTLVVTDDDPDTLTLLSRYLEDPSYKVLRASSGRQALGYLSRGPVHLVLTDLIMPGMDGVALTREVKRRKPEIPVIMVTGFASIETAVQAMQAGAFDYITKPVIPEELRIKVSKALDQSRLQTEISSLKEQVSRRVKAPVLVGESPVMRKVLDLVTLVSQRDVPVVLLGESGTGKELIARAIHEASPRCSRPFVPINCGALPETLLESELFGYQKGAFTGAAASKKGLMEEADGGTLFLDEIADAPVSIQAKLLRALQEGEIRRLGSTQTIAVNVRVLSATNKRLDEEIAASRFREDLYYRLAVVTITVPPLRSRREDIPILADYFVARYRDAINPPVRGLTRQGLAFLAEQEWPGNVRELENLIRRGLVMCRGEYLTEKDLSRGDSPEPEASLEIPAQSGDLTLAAAEAHFLKAYFGDALRRHGGKVPLVASQAGITRKSVYDHMKRLKISPAEYRGG